MYLLVHRFEKKCRTADAGGLVCLGDDAKGRTIGVLTHCDFVGDGESTRDREERAHLRAILVRTPDEAQVAEFGLAPLAPHGWVGVSNAEAEADEAAGDGRHGLGRLLRIARAERLHFDSHEELRELARAGSATCDALVERLGQMYVEVLEQQWLPDTLGRLDVLAQRCADELPGLGAPAVPSNAQARAEVDALLERGYAEVAEACVRSALAPLHAALLRTCAPGGVMLRAGCSAHEARLLSREHERLLRSLVDDAIADARDEWARQTAKLLEGGESANGFRLGRFPAYVAAVLRALDAHADAAFARASAGCSALLGAFFDPSGDSGSFRWEVHAAAGGSLSVTMRSDAERVAALVVRSCTVHLPELDGLRAAHAPLALGGEVEACRSERAEHMQTRARALRAAAELNWGLAGPRDGDTLDVADERQWEAVRRVAQLTAGGGSADDRAWAAARLHAALALFDMDKAKRTTAPSSSSWAPRGLDLALSHIGDVVALALAEVLKVNALTTLKLGQNQIGDAGAVG
ncbi:hypothetical protein T492DRAFT_164868, partial [Pavlovales sp. CCMP2436]